MDFVEDRIGSLPLLQLLFDPMVKLLARASLAGWEYAETQEITVAEGTLIFTGRLVELP